MSLDAWGDCDEQNPAYEAGYEKGRENGYDAGWDDALERAALMLEGMVGSGQDDTTASVRALAMTIRTLTPLPERDRHA